MVLFFFWLLELSQGVSQLLRLLYQGLVCGTDGRHCGTTAPHHSR